MRCGKMNAGSVTKVRLMSPQFVKPYLKSPKNDQADAVAQREWHNCPTCASCHRRVSSNNAV
jgi:hypothetical protein